MKRIAILLISVCLFYDSIGQSISGLIKDESNKGVPSATVALLKAKDSSATKFIVSDKEGIYTFQQIKQGDYLILVTSVGYEKSYSAIFTHRSENQTIPAIKLVRGKNNLSAVTVQASRPFIEMRLDKMVVNVDASPTNAGSNVLEVLGKSPFINVDMDDNISLNGNQGVLILIDGKRTYLSPKDLATLLKSMSSSEIDQIEIMTTPPAKYDADGMAGVINIKTKKSRNDGLNGSFTTSVRTAFFKNHGICYVLPGTENNLNFNYKKNKVNLYGSTGFDIYKGTAISTYDKTYYAPDGTINGYNYFVVKGKWSGNYTPLNVGLDYTADKKNILGIATSTILHGAGSQPRNRISQVLDGNRQVSSDYTAYQIHKYDFHKTTGNINWKHSIDTLGQEFSLDADYVRYRFPSNEELVTTYGNTASFNSTYLNNTSRPSTGITAFKGDYSKPIKNGRIEGGVKTSFVHTKLNNEYFQLVNDKWQTVPTLSSQFSYNEMINAAYLNMNKQIKKWSLQGGLRIERMEAKGKQVSTNNAFSINNTGLFPSLFTSYDINKNNTVKLSYSRRINRPQFYALMPYLSVVDSLDVWHGNPGLKPEHSNRIELSYALQSKYFISLSYTITRDVITYIAAQIGTQRATEFYPVNIDKHKSLTLTISSPIKVTGWWDINVFTSLYSNRYFNVQNNAIPNFYITLSQNISNSFKLTKTLKGELNINYITRQNDQISINEAFLSNFSIGLQKQVLKAKGNLTLNISDPFQWYNYKYTAHFIRMYEIGSSRYASRAIGLTFNYRFGKVNNQSRQRTTASQEEQNR